MKGLYVLPASVLCAVFAAAISIFGQQNSSAELPVRQLQAQFFSGWSDANGRAISAVFAEDADLVIATGLFIHGRNTLRCFIPPSSTPGIKAATRPAKSCKFAS
jgi:hypothetical protein